MLVMGHIYKYTVDCCIYMRIKFRNVEFTDLCIPNTNWDHGAIRIFHDLLKTKIICYLKVFCKSTIHTESQEFAHVAIFLAIGVA